MAAVHPPSPQHDPAQRALDRQHEGHLVEADLLSAPLEAQWWSTPWAKR